MVLSRRQSAAPEGREYSPQRWHRPNPRIRWGAARVFNQHFRDLTGDPNLLAALERALNDPVPYVRFEAAAGLWRWYYWQVDQPAGATWNPGGACHASQYGDGCNGTAGLARKHLRPAG